MHHYFHVDPTRAAKVLPCQVRVTTPSVLGRTIAAHDPELWVLKKVSRDISSIKGLYQTRDCLLSEVRAIFIQQCSCELICGLRHRQVKPSDAERVQLAPASVFYHDDLLEDKNDSPHASEALRLGEVTAQPNAQCALIIKQWSYCLREHQKARW